MRDHIFAIDEALAAGDVSAAVAHANSAMTAGNNDPFVVALVAWKHVENGDFSDAESLLVAGLATSPGNPELLTTLGMARRNQGRLDEALQVLDSAIAIAPHFAWAWLERGLVLHEGNIFAQARTSYAQAAALDPARAAAFAGLAAVYSVEGDIAAARVAGERALRLDVGNAMAHSALARCELATGQVDAATARIQRLLSDHGMEPAPRSVAETILGDALTRQGDADAAFAAYSAAKADLAIRYPVLASRPETSLQLVERLADYAQAESMDVWRSAALAKAPQPVFLLGYPRSGTTLVETILAGLAGVATREELPSLRDAVQQFYEPGEDLRRLDRMEATTAAHLRASYWRRLGMPTGPVKGEMLIDMDPLKSVQLPLIARIFPKAPIIVMQRDPRDVVLSCFRRNFAASPIALEFTTLAGAATHYAATMRLLVACLPRLPNRVFTLRYEALVADFDGETKRLCAFLGRRWTPELRNFAAVARNRPISTASITQVRSNLFDGGGQWRQFADQMEPVIPLLKPWLQHFGYPE